MSSIPLAQLQSDLAHRFLKWALSEKLVQDDVPEHEQQIPMQTQEGQEEQQPLPRQYGHTSDAIDPSMFSNDHYEQAHGQQQQQQQQQQQPVFEATSIAAAGLDWAAAHDLVWPEGDYFMAQKTFIREGVAHLKRGRRYIFVEPVLGPATTFLYPKWTEDPLVEEGYEAGVGGDESVHESGPRYEHSANAGGNDAALEQHQQEQQQEQQQQQQQDKNDDALTTALSAEEPSDDNSSSLSSSGENGVGQGEKQQGEEEEGEGDDKHAGKGENEEGVEMVKQGDDDDEETTADRAHAEQLLSDTGALLAFDMERVEKEETDENAPNSNHSSNNSNNNNNNNNAATSAPAANTTIAAASMNNNNNSSNNATVTNSINSTHASTISNGNATTGISSSTSTSANSQPSMFANRHNHSYHDEDAHHHHAGTACHLLNTSSEFLEPYSPLLDPSTDGQDQFEYGLYELQYIPKVQYLLPHQFLPTRQSFIVHLDEDRPTLASPVPIHSKRSECRCQLMMRKALMQRDLLQVWPQVAPIRTLLEQQQEAEEEARMMEIKQKVQMMTKNWRETLHTQVVTCENEARRVYNQMLSSDITKEK
ncbi:hypothetical protein EDD11_009589 [Mortierella claussenii]|nr:hypothetical protein EDD11_009589 [Mortierella claussenii]